MILEEEICFASFRVSYLLNVYFKCFQFNENVLSIIVNCSVWCKNILKFNNFYIFTSIKCFKFGKKCTFNIWEWSDWCKNFTSLKLCNFKIWRGFIFSLATCLDKISLIIFEIGKNHQITPKNQIMNNYIKSISILPSNNIYKNTAHTIWKDVCNGPSYLVPRVVSFES